MNLLAFNLNGKDYSAGQQSTWTGSTAATDITASSGRPPFTGTNTTCYLSQFYNAVYILGSDSSSPSSVYIYDVATTSWTTQSVTTAGFDPTNYHAILDHDTNVIYALSGQQLYFLDMGSVTAANSSALTWVDADTSPYGSNYSPVMALAQNHIHFLDVPGVAAGSADIFVIHYNYFQPAAQAFPVNGGGTVPATYGATTSLFQESGVQQEFVFVPQDSSATYVINVETNTTQKLAGPTNQDPAATYFAGITSIVQLGSNGAVSFLAYNEADTSANAAATWASVSILPAASSNSSSGSGSGSGSGSSSGGKSGSHTSTASGSSSTSKNGAGRQTAVGIVSAVLAMGAVAASLL